MVTSGGSEGAAPLFQPLSRLFEVVAGLAFSSFELAGEVLLLRDERFPFAHCRLLTLVERGKLLS